MLRKNEINKIFYLQTKGVVSVFDFNVGIIITLLP